MPKVESFRVKCAGGAAAQTLALMDAIYVSRRINRQFVMDYYPFGTGTYWGFEIAKFLKDSETGDTSKSSRGHDITNLQVTLGSIVNSHPINSNKLTLEKVFSFLRRIGLESSLLALRREIPINCKISQLEKVSHRTNAISGGYLPIFDAGVLEELHERFIAARLISPFGRAKSNEQKLGVVLHYRIGDKRAKFTNPKVVGDDGVLDPKTIFKLIENLGYSDKEILLVSDEPLVAKKLLSGEGLNVVISKSKGDIWHDINTMANAKIFIGTWSQVSQIASLCVINRGGRAFLPTNQDGRNTIKWSLPTLDFYKPEFLPMGHPIYFK